MTQYRAGAVWWRLIDFGKGEVKKYFVLLSDDTGDGEVVVAITTSKGDGRYGDARSPSPCAPSGLCYRIEGKQEACFPIDTWVQFDNAATVAVAGLANLASAGRGGFVQSLNDERVRSLLSCARRSEDIPTRCLEEIDKAFKARAPAKKQTTPPTTKATPFVSAELLSLGVWVGRWCDGCKAEFCALVGGITVDELALIVQGKKEPPKDFVEASTTGIQLLEKERVKCSKCPK